ncbi:hypothetical protein [Sutcliffiella sp. FSL R7-0096]|uniref:hypothetical protein n=1 Tax=Sutcliffiella sp. FSL R7-0096 TaxID=2921670 RepID=UPI00315ACD67
MNKFRELKWKFQMFFMKFRYPKAGYYERMCLVAGYTKQDIDEMVQNDINDGLYDGKVNDQWIREGACEEEASCWE